MSTYAWCVRSLMQSIYDCCWFYRVKCFIVVNKGEKYWVWVLGIPYFFPVRAEDEDVIMRGVSSSKTCPLSADFHNSWHSIQKHFCSFMTLRFATTVTNMAWSSSSANLSDAWLFIALNSFRKSLPIYERFLSFFSEIASIAHCAIEFPAIFAHSTNVGLLSSS